MKKREKILAGIAGGLVAILLGVLLFSGPDDSLADLRKRRDELQKEITEKEIKAKGGRKAAAKLAAWRKQALPSNLDRARAEYHTWLRDLIVEAGFDKANVEPGQQKTQKKICTVFPFRVSGEVQMRQLVDFLYKFYSAGHLHQIRRLSIKPVNDDRTLDVVLSIEAMSLPRADRKDELSETPSERLRREELGPYVMTIAGRRLFSPYVEIRPPVGPDMAEETYVSAIVEVGGRAQVWLHIRSRNRTLKVGEGEEFDLSYSQRGTVLKVADPRHVEIELDGQRRRIPLKSNLTGGELLPEEGEAASDEERRLLEDLGLFPEE